MPRPNPPRSINAERYLASRIRLEREKYGLSYEALSKRMGEAGCPLASSSLFKIEQQDPPRRITVDEFVAFSRVFNITVEQLLQDANQPAEDKAWNLIEQYRQLDQERQELRNRIGQVTKQMLLLIADDPRPELTTVHPGELKEGTVEALATIVRTEGGAGRIEGLAPTEAEVGAKARKLATERATRKRSS